MKHSLFDKIFLGFLVLLVSVFGLLIFYSTKATKDALVEDRTLALTNEAVLIGEQSISAYYMGLISEETLAANLEIYSSTLDSSIWIMDSKGIVIASAAAPNHPEAPKNLYFLDYEFDMTSNQTFTGTFYDTFKEDVISVCTPIFTMDNTPNGMIILHSTFQSVSEMQRNLLSAVYVPFLVMLVVSFSLLAIISRKIMRPIKKINTVAEEYSKGNFDSKMEISSQDEIGQLASTLEYMASELSKLDEYRKDFISNISHDFRSPLTSIKGYIEAILDGTIPPEKQDKYLNIVVQETNRLSKLTSSLLELNNADTYGLWLVFKDFDIVQLVKNAMRTFEGKCEGKNISLILNNHCDKSKVHGDKTKIEQVIYNLLDNAIKFTPEGKSIYITLTEKSEKIFVSVKDEGCGIPKDSVNKVWTRFYKADASRGKDKQGTGLGLSITKEIIKAHNENINVVSTEGVGSEFSFSLSKASKEDTDTTKE